MLSNKRLVAVCAIILCINIALLIYFIKFYKGEECFVLIKENQKVLNTIPDDFLSIGIDASEVENYDTVDFSNKLFRNLASALAPARLRLGGTMSDRLIFIDEDVKSLSCEGFDCYLNHKKHVCATLKQLCKQKNRPFFIMTAKKWNQLNEFCNATNNKLLFSLNVLIRNENSWNDINAREIISYSKSKNYNIDWQLGNEPNSFKHTFNITITPKQLAQDFRKLRNILNEHGYQNSLLVGPDTTRPQPRRRECMEYMVQFLGNGSNYINVRSWHQYYLNSKTAKLPDFWNLNTLLLLEDQIKTMKSQTKAYEHIPMWLTETSSSYGGGVPGLSNTFAGTPLWVDKLGQCAKNNISTVVRQSLIGGNYSLLTKDFYPLPDWWVSVLFKKLVGNKVLEINCNCEKRIRMYAHCTNKNYINDSTAITIYAINLEVSVTRINLNGTALPGDNLDIDEFIISAPGHLRMAKTILLNGWKLIYTGPKLELQPRKLKFGKNITMPPFSIGFWVIKNTSIKVC